MAYSTLSRASHTKGDSGGPERTSSHSPVHDEGWMVSGYERVFGWVPVPQQLTMVVSSVAFLTTYLLTTLLACKLLVGSKLQSYIYVQTIHLSSSHTYFPTSLLTYKSYFLLNGLPYNNSVEVHPQLKSHSIRWMVCWQLLVH